MRRDGGVMAGMWQTLISDNGVRFTPLIAAMFALDLTSLRGGQIACCLYVCFCTSTTVTRYVFTPTATATTTTFCMSRRCRNKGAIIPEWRQAQPHAKCPSSTRHIGCMSTSSNTRENATLISALATWSWPSSAHGCRWCGHVSSRSMCHPWKVTFPLSRAAHSARWPEVPDVVLLGVLV